MQRAMKIAVAGAGIGGLTAALALKNSGFDPELYERSRLDNEAGAGIQLSPNAVKVLHALGLKSELEACGFQPQAVRLRSAGNGRLIAYRPLGGFSEDRYGAPYYHLHRHTLHRLLVDQVHSRGIPLHTGVTAETAQETDDQVVLVTDQGEVRADLLVAADGLRSRLQQALQPEAPAIESAGMVAYRAVVPTAALPRRLVEPAATVWMGPGAHLVHYYVDDGSRINLIGVVETDNDVQEASGSAVDPAALQDAFKGWNRRLTRLLVAAESCHRWPLYQRPPLPVWSTARTTLLGDAAHPMLPFLAQGAAMAIEDGWVLSRVLEHREDEHPAKALSQYEQLRRMRTRKVQDESAAQGQMFHLRSPGARVARNLKLGVGCRLLPDLAMAQFDWLHGYDPVRRFR